MADNSIVSKTTKTKAEPKLKKAKRVIDVTDAEIVSKPSKKQPEKKAESYIDNNDIRAQSKYAVVVINGQQEIIFEGQKLEVNHIGDEIPKITEVLLFVDGDTVKDGTPTVEGIKVTLKNDGIIRGKKINVREFHAKSRYRRAKGSRATYTSLTVESIKE